MSGKNPACLAFLTYTAPMPSVTTIWLTGLGNKCRRNVRRGRVPAVALLCPPLATSGIDLGAELSCLYIHRGDFSTWLDIRTLQGPEGGGGGGWKWAVPPLPTYLPGLASSCVVFSSDLEGPQ